MDLIEMAEYVRTVEEHKRRGRRIALTWLFIISFCAAYFGFGVLRALASTDLCQIALTRIEIKYERISNRETQTLIKVNGEIAGVYKYKLDGTTAEVSTFTMKRYKNRGYSKMFARDMLKREPQLTDVTATLVLDNLAATQLIWYNKPLTLEQCIKATAVAPFTKTFKRLGFEMTECDFNHLTKFLRVRMTKLPVVVGEME